MKKIFYPLFVLVFSAAVYADGLAADTQESIPPAAKASLRSRQSLALHIRATRIKNPEKRLPLMLKSLALAPEDQMPLQMLQQFCLTQKPPLNIKAAEGVLDIAEKHPELLQLNLEAIQMSFELSPELAERIKRTAARAVKSGRSQSPRAAFLALLGIHLQDLTEQQKFDTAYDFLKQIIAETAEPELALIHWNGKISQAAARTASTQRRWLGLRQSEQAMWQERQAQAVDAARQYDEKLQDLAAIESQVEFYLQMRCPDAALRLADECTKKFTDTTDAEFLKQAVLLRTRRNQEAYALAQKLIKVSPESPACLRRLAVSAMRCGEYDAALAAGHKLLQVCGEQDEDNRYYIVLPLILSNRQQEAQREIDRITNQELRLALKNVLSTRFRDWTEDLAKLRKLQTNPGFSDDESFWHTLLSIAEQLKDVKLFEECWLNFEKKGLLKDASNANNIGYVATVLDHRLDEAGKLIKFALDAEPDNGAYMDSMAWHLYKTGNYEKAWEYIQKAIEAMENEASLGAALDHAGDIALKLGKKNEALQYYRQALGDYLAPDLDLQAVQEKIRKLTAEEK